MTDTRTLPMDMDAEKAGLSCMLQRNSCIPEFMAIAPPISYFFPPHQLLAQIIADLIELHPEGGIDFITISGHVQKFPDLVKELGPYGIRDLAALEAIPEHAMRYAEVIRDRWLRRQAADAAHRAFLAAHNLDHEVGEIISTVCNELEAVQADTVGEVATTLHDGLTRAMVDLSDRRSRGTPVGVQTGIAEFDNASGGVGPGDVAVCAGRPSMGKTSLTLSVTDHMGRHADGAVVFFSLEQSDGELCNRILANAAGVDGLRIKKGDVTDAELERLSEATEARRDVKVFVDFKPDRSVSEMKAIVRSIKRQTPVSVVAIDYLQLIRSENPKLIREQQVSEIMKGLKNLARNEKVAVILLSQLNRGLETRPDKTPKLSDLRESGSIEQDADMVLFLHRPEVYNPTDRPGETDLILAKNRNGPKKTIRLRWEPEFMRFSPAQEVAEDVAWNGFRDAANYGAG